MTWQKSEQTLSIHSITTQARELFYWAAVVATFALGTAAGDIDCRTGCTGLLPLCRALRRRDRGPAVGYWRFHWNAVFAFWFAYVVTRPLGASFADWMGKPASPAGSGWGRGG